LVRSAVGTIGLIAAVPITTALAALAATRVKHEDKPERSLPANRPAEDPWTAFIEDGRSRR
jgi:hypothetical protein